MRTLFETRRHQPRAGHRSSPGVRSSARKNDALKIRSILVPIDFSTPSMRAYGVALQLARQFKARLTVLHVIEAVAVPEFAAYPLVPNSDRLESTKKKLAALATEQGCGEMLQAVKVRTGVPFREITQAAESLKADMIVIATHGYTGITRVLLGSTAERVVRHARCPVLIVPTKNGTAKRTFE